MRGALGIASQLQGSSFRHGGTSMPSGAMRSSASAIQRRSSSDDLLNNKPRAAASARWRAISSALATQGGMPF